MHAFYANPLVFVKSLLLIIVLPYLVYIFWGSVIVVGLIALAIFLAYRYFKNRKQGNAYTS